MHVVEALEYEPWRNRQPLPAKRRDGSADDDGNAGGKKWRRDRS
jgi:hypothetical protein